MDEMENAVNSDIDDLAQKAMSNVFEKLDLTGDEEVTHDAPDEELKHFEPETDESEEPVSEGEIEEEEDSPKEEDNAFIAFLEDGSEFKVPKNLKIPLETKRGRKLEKTFEELTEAAWAKEEGTRLTQEVSRLKKIEEDYVKMTGLQNVVNENNLSGADWAYSVLLEAYRANPEKAKDVEEFMTSLWNNTFDIQAAERTALRRDQAKFDDKKESEVTQEELQAADEQMTKTLLDYFGMDSDSFGDRVDQLFTEGKLKTPSNINELHETALQVQAEILTDRALDIRDKLSMTDAEWNKYSGDLASLLRADPRNPDKVAEKLSAVMGRRTKRAKEKAEKFRQRKAGTRRHVSKPIQEGSTFELRDGETPMERILRLNGRIG